LYSSRRVPASIKLSPSDCTKLPAATFGNHIQRTPTSDNKLVISEVAHNVKTIQHQRRCNQLVRLIDDLIHNWRAPAGFKPLITSSDHELRLKETIVRRSIGKERLGLTK